MSLGRRVRRARLLPGGRGFLVALDHVVPRGLAVAPADPEGGLRLLGGPPALCDGVLIHHGLAERAAEILSSARLPFLVKLSAATTASPDRLRRASVASVERAVRLGADGVGLNLYIGADYEAEALERLADVEEGCDRYGMPLMLMINPLPDWAYDADRLAYVARVGAELGADLVKTDYSGAPESFRRVVEAAGGIPVLVEESPLTENEDGTLTTVEGVLAAGGAGVLLGGRFWAAPDPAGLAGRVGALVHGAAG